jgi:dihydroorotate dehydrogenase
VSIKKPWLFLPAPVAHVALPLILPIASRILNCAPLEFKSLEWQGLKFKNPLGIAGGVDKNADNIHDWIRLGAGFIEIGTITPKSQTANPGVILDRSTKLKALWNKMGFPNQGAGRVQKKLAVTVPFSVPVFANIGKNRETPNELADSDYVSCMQTLSPFVDAFVVNISSPNTTGLRALLEPKSLRHLINSILLQKPKGKPVLLKLSPDMNEHETLSAIDIASEAGVDGFTLTNTLANNSKYFPGHEGGGVSGLPLAAIAKEKLKLTHAHLKRLNIKKLIISVGGVLTPKEALERLELGADLVQIYSGLIFWGPGFFKAVAKEVNTHGA